MCPSLQRSLFQSCLSIHYGFGNVGGQNRVGDCNLLGGSTGAPTGVDQDFIAGVPCPPQTPVTPAMQPSDTCPGLSTDGPQKRVEGSVEYKFFCGKWSAAGGPLKSGYKVGSLQKCLRDCYADPACKSCYHGFGNTGVQNRVGECNLSGTTQTTPRGIDGDFVAAIPGPPRPVAVMQASDTCPGLGTGGSQKCTEGVTEYKVLLWQVGVTSEGNVGNLQQCLRDCNSTPTCMSIFCGF